MTSHWPGHHDGSKTCGCPKCKQSRANLLGPDDPRLAAEHWITGTTAPMRMVDTGPFDREAHEEALASVVYWKAKSTEAHVKLGDANRRLHEREEALRTAWNHANAWFWISVVLTFLCAFLITLVGATLT